MDSVVKLDKINYESICLQSEIIDDKDFFILNKPFIFETPWVATSITKLDISLHLIKLQFIKFT